MLNQKLGAFFPRVCVCDAYKMFRAHSKLVEKSKQERNLHQRNGIYDYQLRITKIYGRKSL